MTAVVVNVDESILKEAEKALHSIGMDVEMAVNVFLRRVAIEKGLPMSMTTLASNKTNFVVAAKSQELSQAENTNQKRSNNAITGDMVESFYDNLFET